MIIPTDRGQFLQSSARSVAGLSAFLSDRSSIHTQSSALGVTPMQALIRNPERTPVTSTDSLNRHPTKLSRPEIYLRFDLDGLDFFCYFV
jgi:hypothetical protein